MFDLKSVPVTLFGCKFKGVCEFCFETEVQFELFYLGRSIYDSEDGQIILIFGMIDDWIVILHVLLFNCQNKFGKYGEASLVDDAPNDDLGG